MFETILIANRGEIAVRVIRACRELGIRSVAVFSEADRASPHVLLADAAYPIGPPPASESYLRADRILEAAHAAGADAIHPGYGFLAENERFARAVENAGMIFIGPSPETIAAMGDKTEARRRMQEAGVPIVPGGVAPVTDEEDAAKAGRELGFPVLLKASVGGGGKGMRVVERSDELHRAFEAAAREAQAAFGDGSIYVEKYLERPRHIEFQVLGDAYGAVVHLGERECSIQRRHQKLVEEAPSVVLSPDQREAMGRASVAAAQAVEYRGAGTVEFLYLDGSFYFLEMNTRLQVEHPVTEAITGIDLVHEQLRIAAGQPLEVTQDEIELRGHAIECRITSEDAEGGFLPSTGTITRFAVPSGPGVRWDGGIEQGLAIGLHYDSLLGKLIVHAPTRDAAIARMASALDELAVDGVDSSISFHRRVMADADFRAGDLSIAFVEDHPELSLPDLTTGERRAIAVAAALLEHSTQRALQVPPAGSGHATTALSAWQTSGWPWRSDPLGPHGSGR